MTVPFSDRRYQCKDATGCGVEGSRKLSVTSRFTYSDLV
jgi:hypothetical protein